MRGYLGWADALVSTAQLPTNDLNFFISKIFLHFIGILPSQSGRNKLSYVKHSKFIQNLIFVEYLLSLNTRK